jgi:MFS family permease
VRRLLTERNFRLLLIGQTLTMFGDVALFLVLGIWVKRLTGSNGAVGAVFLVLTLPAFLAPLAGLVIDRFPRRRVMIANDVASALAVLCLLFVQDRGDLWIIYVVAALYGLSQQVFFAARSGLLVTMLPAEDLGDANGLLESIRQGLRIVGPLVGAALFAATDSGAPVAILDAMTFLGSSLCLWFLRARDLVSERRGVSVWNEVSAGIRHIFSTVEIRLVVVCTAIVLAFVGLSEVAFFAVVDRLGRPPEFVGVIGTIQGAGAIVGGFLAPRSMRREGELWLVAAALVVLGVGFAVFGLTAVEIVALLGAAVVGVAVTGFTVAYATLLQRRTSPEMQGRVFTAAEAIFTIPYAGSIGVAALVISVIDVRVIYAAEAVVLIACGVYLFARRRSLPAPGTSAPADTVAT